MCSSLGLMPGATWEVDRKGLVTGIPVAMYLLSGKYFLFKIN